MFKQKNPEGEETKIAAKKQWTSKIKRTNSVSSVFDICSRRRGGILLHWMHKNPSRRMVSQAWILRRQQGRLGPPKSIKGGLILQAVTSECTSRAQFFYSSKNLLGNSENVAKFWKLVEVQWTWGGYFSGLYTPSERQFLSDLWPCILLLTWTKKPYTQTKVRYFPLLTQIPQPPSNTRPTHLPSALGLSLELWTLILASVYQWA